MPGMSCESCSNQTAGHSVGVGQREIKPETVRPCKQSNRTPAHCNKPQSCFPSNHSSPGAAQSLVRSHLLPRFHLCIQYLLVHTNGKRRQARLAGRPECTPRCGAATLRATQWSTTRPEVDCLWLSHLTLCLAGCSNCRGCLLLEHKLAGLELLFLHLPRNCTCRTHS